MPPKKKGKGGKKKKDDGSEPPHDPSWERAVDTGVWERPSVDLPDANTWPTWGALRERVLTACKEVKITNTASLRDAFCTELVKLSPPELALLDLQQSSNLRNFTLSPATACPQLATLDLSCCKNLTNVLIQSNSIRSMALQGCTSLHKVLLHCPHLSQLAITNCPALDTVMLWSDELTTLDLSGCTSIITLKLQCPALIEQKVPPLKFIEKHVKPVHPPIASMLKENYTALAAKAEARDAEMTSLQSQNQLSIIPRAYRGI